MIMIPEKQLLITNVHTLSIPLGSSLALRTNPVPDWLESVPSISASMSKSFGFTSKSAGGLTSGFSWFLLNDCGNIIIIPVMINSVYIVMFVYTRAVAKSMHIVQLLFSRYA